MKAWLARLLPRAARYLLIYVAIVAAAAVVYLRLPTSFLPNEDQGTMLVNVQLPPAPRRSARAVMEQVEGFMLKQPEVQSMVGVLGFSFSGQGQNAALAFVTLKDWSERTDPASRRRPSPGARLARCRHARCLHLPTKPAAHPGAGRGLRLHLPPAGPRRRWAATRCWPRATSCWAWPRKQGAHPGAPGRAGGRAATAGRHRPRQGQRAGRGFDAINAT
jgi:hypothetical protein